MSIGYHQKNAFPQGEGEQNWRNQKEGHTPFKESKTSTYAGEQSRGSSHGSYTGIADEGQMQADMISALEGADAVEAFGGVLLQGKNSHEGDVVVHAVNSVVKEDAKRLVNDHYYKLTTNNPDLFMAYDHSDPIGRYTMFSFRLPAGYQSLRSLMDHPDARGYGNKLFRELVDFIAAYERDACGAKPYKALCCLSLDTVYIHVASGKIRVVPLAAYNNNYPRYYPGEAGEPVADITTDLYTAALTTLQFISGSDLETEEKKMVGGDDIPGLEDCLRVFQSRRPTLREVQAALDNKKNGSAGYGRNTGPDGEREKPFAKRYEERGQNSGQKNPVKMEELLKRIFGGKSDTFTGI